MKTFKDLKFKKDKHAEGIQAYIFFANNYGASVIKNKYSYGNEKGLYEIAVLNSDKAITYDTPITKDVIGNLTPEEVTETLIKIQTL